MTTSAFKLITGTLPKAGQSSLAGLTRHVDISAALSQIKEPFAFAAELPGGRMLLAADRFAMQTLCWRQDGVRLLVNQRADALAQGTSIDPQAIYEYLFFHCIPSPRTIFKQVFRLPPGRYAIFENGRLNIQPFCNPVFKPEHQDFNTTRQRFLALLEQSVAAELDGNKPGCFLSGGTDSSTVAGMIRRATGLKPATYSIGFEAEGYDEMEFARIAARHFDTEHHEYYVTPADLLDSIPTVAAYYDQPFGNSSALPAYYCAKMAREDGITRLLAGDGGDELFGGNSRYSKQKIFGWYQRVPAPLRVSLLEPLFGTALAKSTPLLTKGSSYIEQARVPMPARLQIYNLLLRLGPDAVLSPAFLASVDTASPIQHQQMVWDEVTEASELNKTLAFDWRYTLSESDLPKVRETARLAGVGVGFPMLNRDLLDFSLTLPDDYKLRGLKLRWFFKEALRGFLPDEILVKKKQGFGLPFGIWLTRNQALMKLAKDSVHSLESRGILNPDFIKSVFDTLLPAHPSYYGEMIWILMMLEQWLQKHAPSYKVV